MLSEQSVVFSENMDNMAAKIAQSVCATAAFAKKLRFIQNFRIICMSGRKGASA